MLRIPVFRKSLTHNLINYRYNSSSSFIRNTFIEYFTSKHNHKFIKSSSVVPLCDPTVPFVNAGMNQFKGVFLGKVQAPCLRAVNSQKCVRVGGKHNDLEVVGSDGTHHTFFEMLGNWSFGDYYKKEACQMAWDLLLGPYRLKPENLLVTYFGGDVVIGMKEDTECRDIWKAIGVPADRIRPMNASDNFWEMGATGPCGPCTEIHYINSDGSLTEIWNIVFMECNRDLDGKVRPLGTQHVDTGMGLERMAALKQGVVSNYDTDLFVPILRAIHEHSSSVPAYGGRFITDEPGGHLDATYRRLADHARCVSVCLADELYPVTSLNLKQLLRKCFKMSWDVFHCPSGMMEHLYDRVSETLSPTYPELEGNAQAAKLVLRQEEAAYRKLRAEVDRKWKSLRKRYEEVTQLGEVEMSGFAAGYTEFKETLAKLKTPVAPGELIFKLYDTYGFQEDLIQRIATLNNVEIDKPGFWRLLEKHRARHKTALKEQTNSRTSMFQQAIEKLKKKGNTKSNDEHKYHYSIENNKLQMEPLKTKLLAILNEDGEWIDYLQPSENSPYYLITKDTNFYCEEGGQAADSGVITINDQVSMKVDTVFKIKDFVFHKGVFIVKDEDCQTKCVSINSEVLLNIDREKRLKVMCNHTATHLLNAAIRKALPNSVVSQTGSKVTEDGLSLTLSIYGEKISDKVIAEVEEMISQSISRSVAVHTDVVDSVSVSRHGHVLTVPGELYPETGLRLVSMEDEGLTSKELCCGTHVSQTGWLGGFCVVRVKGAASHAPTLYALTRDRAHEALELFCRAEKLKEVIQFIEPERLKAEVSSLKRSLESTCGTSGAPCGQYAQCLTTVDSLKPTAEGHVELETLAEEEMCQATESAMSSGQQYVVHFVRCSYLTRSPPRALRAPRTLPALALACAQGTLHCAATVPQEYVSAQFSAASWVRAVLPALRTRLCPDAGPTLAAIEPTKVSLITCEQMVQNAVTAAENFAAARLSHPQHSTQDTKDRSTN